MSCIVDLNTYQWSVATTQLLYSYPELLDIIDLNTHELNIATKYTYSYLELLNINSRAGSITLGCFAVSVTIQFLYFITKILDMSSRVGLSPQTWNISLDIVFEYS